MTASRYETLTSSVSKRALERWRLSSNSDNIAKETQILAEGTEKLKEYCQATPDSVTKHQCTVASYLITKAEILVKKKQSASKRAWLSQQLSTTTKQPTYEYDKDKPLQELFDNAEALLLQATKSGSVNALFLLGNLYDPGTSFARRDAATSQFWNFKAAEKNHPFAKLRIFEYRLRDPHADLIANLDWAFSALEQNASPRIANSLRNEVFKLINDPRLREKVGNTVFKFYQGVFMAVTPDQPNTTSSLIVKDFNHIVQYDAELFTSLLMSQPQTRIDRILPLLNASELIIVRHLKAEMQLAIKQAFLIKTPLPQDLLPIVIDYCCSQTSQLHEKIAARKCKQQFRTLSKALTTHLNPELKKESNYTFTLFCKITCPRKRKLYVFSDTEKASCRAVLMSLERETVLLANEEKNEELLSAERYTNAIEKIIIEAVLPAQDSSDILNTKCQKILKKCGIFNLKIMDEMNQHKMPQLR